VRLKVYQARDGRAPFEEWFESLDGSLKRAVQRRLRAIEEYGHFGVRKNLRGGLHELKFRQVIRIYFSEIGGEVVLFLGGSGKRDQRKEIESARDRLKEFNCRDN